MDTRRGLGLGGLGGGFFWGGGGGGGVGVFGGVFLGFWWFVWVFGSLGGGVGWCGLGWVGDLKKEEPVRGK